MNRRRNANVSASSFGTETSRDLSGLTQSHVHRDQASQGLAVSSNPRRHVSLSASESDSETDGLRVADLPIQGNLFLL